MGRRSCIPAILTVQLGALFLMLSCGSRQPIQQITLHAPSGFYGEIHLATCVSSAPATELWVDTNGEGTTSACPSHDGSIRIVVLRGDQRVEIEPENVTIARSGDNIATAIRAQVRP